MAAKKNEEMKNLSSDETPKKSPRKTTKKTSEEPEKPKRSYSWKSNVKKPSEKASDSDIDLRDIAYQQGRRYSQDTDLRAKLTTWVTCIISVWLAVCLLILIFKGLGLFHLDTTETVTLLSTTTANIIALGYIVLKGMFGADPTLPNT